MNKIFLYIVNLPAAFTLSAATAMPAVAQRADAPLRGAYRSPLTLA